jgi:hypothetical protein
VKATRFLLQVPMEPFDYPDNDPGPQTLLTSLTPQQNIDRLYWLMSRFQGYVGIANAMGARFTASEPSFAPVLRETAKRGLIFVDDGSNPRSVAGRIAGANNLPFAKADVISIRFRRRPKSIARSAAWKWRRASAASRSAFRRRCRCRSITSPNGRRRRRAAACCWFRSPRSRRRRSRAEGKRITTTAS